MKDEKKKLKAEQAKIEEAKRQASSPANPVNNNALFNTYTFVFSLHSSYMLPH
jgi:hypothetical protein